jgi:hypothetical protein
MTPHEETAGERIRGGIGVFVTLAGVVASLTILFLSMRSVMDIGGSCASGGPYVPRVECPSGVPMLLVGSIWCGLVFAALYFWMTFRHGAPSLGALFWPALFLSLGFNFLSYGLNPPFGLGGVEVGWLICAVVFGLMGGIPLLAAIPAVWRSFHGTGVKDRAREWIWPRRSAPATSATPWGADGWFHATDPSGAGATAPPSGSSASTDPVATGVPGIGFALPTSVTPTPDAATSTPAGEWVASGTPDAVVSALERLEALHRSGALSDAQYEEAKRRVLGSS